MKSCMEPQYSKRGDKIDTPLVERGQGLPLSLGTFLSVPIEPSGPQIDHPHKLFRARFSGEMSTLGSGHLPSSRSHCNLLPCGSRSGHSLGGCSHRGQEGPARSIHWDIDGRAFLEPPLHLAWLMSFWKAPLCGFCDVVLSLFLLPLLLLLRLHCRLLFLSASWRAPASSPLLTLHALPG